MKVLFVCAGDFRGPSEKQVLGFGRELLRRGHEVMVAVGGDPASARHESPPNGLRVTHFRFRGPQIRGPLSADARRFAPDVIHAFSPRLRPMRAAAAAADALDRPLLVHFEDDEWTLAAARAGDGLARRLARASARRLAGVAPALWPYATPESMTIARRRAAGVDAIVPTLSREVERRLGRNCVAILPAGSNTEVGDAVNGAAPVIDERPLVAYTGNVFGAHAQDFRLLVRAMGDVRARGVEALFVHAGAIAPRLNLEDDLRAAGLDVHDARFLGYLPRRRVPALLRAAEVLVQPGHPSDFNRFRLPSKLQDYLAAGVPTVTFAVGVGELLEDRVEVLKTRTGSPSELADRITEALTDRTLATGLREGGPRAAARLFDPVRNTNALLEYYEAAL